LNVFASSRFSRATYQELAAHDHEPRYPQLAEQGETMRLIVAGLMGACAGASAVGLVWQMSSDRSPALASPLVEASTEAATAAFSSRTVTAAAAPAPDCDPTALALAAKAFTAPPSDREREARIRVANNVFANGAAWEAEHGEKRGMAAHVVSKKKALDKYLEGPPDPAWNQEVMKNLDRILGSGDTHVSNAECSSRACRVELLHEADVNAFDSSPERLMAAAPGTFVDTLVDRSDEDGQLHTYVYYRKPEALPKEHRQAAAELLRQQEVLSKFDVN
jgi:hypothetical protein